MIACTRPGGTGAFRAHIRCDLSSRGLSAQGTTASVASQSEVPTFTAALLDRWGNKTGPCQGLKCSLIVECTGLEPTRSIVAFDETSGLATVSGQHHKDSWGR